MRICRILFLCGVWCPEIQFDVFLHAMRILLLHEVSRAATVIHQGDTYHPVSQGVPRRPLELHEVCCSLEEGGENTGEVFLG